MSDDERTLADDEQALARYADQLADAFDAVARSWLHRLVRRHLPDVPRQVQPQLDLAADNAAVDLRRLLARDIADQETGPLELLRRAVRPATDTLAEAGVVAPPRDEFALRNFPDDHYGLAPASFADIDASLHEPGLIWGAAKAHVHLRRRRESAAE